MAYEPKPVNGKFYKKSGVSKNTGLPWEFHTGDLNFYEDYFYNGVNLKGLKIPLKLNANIFKKHDKQPSFLIELNEWKKEDSKLSKPEHAMALDASIRKSIEPQAAPKPVVEPDFNEDDLPF